MQKVAEVECKVVGKLVVISTDKMEKEEEIVDTSPYWNKMCMSLC